MKSGNLGSSHPAESSYVSDKDFGVRLIKRDMRGTGDTGESYDSTKVLA
jgi:hypothetical protein